MVKEFDRGKGGLKDEHHLIIRTEVSICGTLTETTERDEESIYREILQRVGITKGTGRRTKLLEMRGR